MCVNVFKRFEPLDMGPSEAGGYTPRFFLNFGAFYSARTPAALLKVV